MALITEQLIRKQISSNHIDENDTNENYFDSSSCNCKGSSKNELTLNLSFQNIERMGNLSGFGKITHLLLNNNNIENIAGLETLIHLKRLDLSFNKIKKIEGLSKLVNLEVLSLYHNQIDKISCLERCYRLYSLSLGMNKIHDIGNLLCLNHLQKLRDLVLTGNPICEEQGGKYRNLVLYNLPWIQYFDNAKVTQEEIIELASKSKLDVDSRVTISDAVHKDEKDCTHPLELIVVDLSKEVSRYGMTARVQPVINQIWDLINEYLTNMLELNDIFTGQINLLKDQIHTSSHEAIGDIVSIKDKLKSEKIQDADQNRDEDAVQRNNENSERCNCMMDIELELSNNVELLINNFRIEWIETKISKSRNDMKKKSIDSFMNLVEFLRSEFATITDEQTRISESECIPEQVLDNFEKGIQHALHKMEAEGERNHILQLKLCEDDFQVNHRTRITEIHHFISSQND